MSHLTNIKYIFDVGANDGTDGLGIAILNKNYFIHAFEPNPYLINKIIKLKKKLEKRKGIKINNYKIHKLAISDKSKIGYFYISKNDKVSSLNKISKNLNKSWPGYKDSIFKTIKKIKVKIINLKDFVKKNNIKTIRYIHIDTQGNDLKVLKGLKEKINIVQEGKMEAAVSKKKAAYLNNHTIQDVKKFFSRFNFLISKIKNKNFKMIEEIKTNYNIRYFGRLLRNETYLKDDIVDFLIKIKNKILN